MSAETRLVARLKALEAVAAIVAARVWPHGHVPQPAAMPYIEHRLIDGVPINHAGGAVNDMFQRFQLNLVAADHDAARELAAAVRGDPEAVGGPSGLSGWTDADGRMWHLETETTDVESTAAGTDLPEAFIAIQDYLC